MRDIKSRLISVTGEIVGYEKWYSGALDSKNFWEAKPCWLYSKDGKYWNPKPIPHRYKDQYTGLKDKNEKEIYEGDLFEIEGRIDKVGWFYEGAMFCLYRYFKGCWQLSEYNINRECEIMGNIHENPELIGV